MDKADPSKAELHQALTRLTARVEALEAMMRPQPPGPSSDDAVDSPFWALDSLKRRRADHPATVDGAVLFAGTVTLPTGEPVEWQEAAGSAGLLESDWSSQVPALSALAHPVRLELLRQVLIGVRTTAELAAVESLGSTGQLHHHLRQLVAAGWLRHSGRGSYEVPAPRIVPLLVTLTAVQR
ncbi:ArsR/SmtB family transcription factor [Phytoactinopolyspora mesophila]|uniref:Helix-turn-helix domain-containing protein n=1 Tax=Phytoactinopolyspora mesophila TaxID=2650750 RepID=A0A7K3M1B0_9ACTN|nr:helix-turn-helix domain-containing protein [Phytoactinopolyspora mesophila]NDL57081.1 helix-turn-helix domain-containing protein [Phytoactinopolyspora mesophila]